jgi:uncharacterized protein YlxP (DUF503 family)
MSSLPKIYLGAVKMELSIPGARSLKDRRQGVRSVMDRIAARFPVSIHEVDGAGDVGRATLVATTAGAEHGQVRDALSRVRDLVAMHPVVVLVDVAYDLRRWDAFEVGLFAASGAASDEE